jgi:hypothetical protein
MIMKRNRIRNAVIPNGCEGPHNRSLITLQDLRDVNIDREPPRRLGAARDDPLEIFGRSGDSAK